MTHVELTESQLASATPVRLSSVSAVFAILIVLLLLGVAIGAIWS
jgi:hypothetical protein